MTLSSYPQASKLLLQHEGGFVNHPSDPGGATNRGITIYDARRYAAEYGWISGRTVTVNDMRSLPLWFAERVYKAKYWDAMNCDRLEPGVDYAIFDYGVNSGTGRAGRVLRRIIGASDQTSSITDDIAVIAQRLPAKLLVDKICDERMAFLRGLKTFPTFGKGWTRRVSEVRAYAIKIAEDLPITDAPAIVPAAGRAIEPLTFAKVRALQIELAAGGFYKGAIDGDLGPMTVKAFQRASGLVVDGIVGPKTRPLLDAAIAAITPAMAAA